jgi:hypothetical protein
MKKIWIVQERSLNSPTRDAEAFTSDVKALKYFNDMVLEYGVEPNDAMFDSDGWARFMTEGDNIVELFSMYLS